MIMTKVQPCDTTLHVLTAYKGAAYEESFRIELLQYWKVCSAFAVRVSGTSLFTVIKYMRLKPRLNFYKKD